MAICEAKELFHLGSIRLMWAGSEIPVGYALNRKQSQGFSTETLTVNTVAPNTVTYLYKTCSIGGGGIGLDAPKIAGKDINRDNYL